MTYRVNDIYPSIQGEGALTGTPMAVVRLQGCGVGCPWCDTKETWEAQAGHQKATIQEVLEAGRPSPAWCEMSGAELIGTVANTWPQLEWILLTGGEPAEQDLGDLWEAASVYGKRICLETSGTARGHLDYVRFNDHVTVSPKLGMPGGRKVLREVVADADELKFVVGKPADLQKWDLFLGSYFDQEQLELLPRISLQPLSCSEKATRLCVEEAMKRGWHLSIQTHKFLQVP